MALNSLRIHWFDGIGPILDYMALNVAQNVTEAMTEGAQELESYAKANAPWDDQTGAAREGLTAEVGVDFGGEVSIDLFHSVEYGYWLELIQNGAYAIIMPTIEALGPEIIRKAGGKVMEIP